MALFPAGLPKTRLVTLVLCVATLIGVALPRPVRAQSDGGVPIDVVIIWIEGRVSPQRVWRTDIERKGIAFMMDPGTEARLHMAGATDDWIQMLRGARSTVSAGSRESGVPPQILPRNAAVQRHYSRAQLMPLYFERETRFETYVSAAQLQETGGTVSGQTMQTSDGSVTLQSVPLSRNAITYGIVVGTPNVALDLEGYFHQPNLMMINIGLALDEFLPISTTGLRAIVGLTPFVGDTRQIIGHTLRQSGDTSDNAIELHNAVLGGDARIGLAYHWQPGKWIYVEGHYRGATTLTRELVLPHESNISDGLPWSKWSAHGPLVRVGFGL